VLEKGQLAEAATIKTRAQALFRDADAILGDKLLPKDLREKVQNLRAALKKRWADLAADETPAKTPAKATESARKAPDRDAWLAEAADTLRQADSMDTIRGQVQTALRQRYGSYDGPWPWIQDLYPDVVVFRLGDDLFRCDYTIDQAAETVTLGDPTEVEVAYIPVTDNDPLPGDGTVTESSAELGGDVVPLVEGVVRRDGTVPLKLIQPGWGSSGYYPADVLERDGPAVFPKGTKMFWDHPTVSEDAERPERSIRDFAAELTSAARWETAGTAGPGLYADAKVFSPYQPAVEELAPHIGVSIRAMGQTAEGAAEGRKGKVVQKLLSSKSVDFVTTPGAGGQVLQLFEAARNGRATTPEGGTNVTEQEAKALREAQAASSTELAEAKTQLARLQEGLAIRDARDLAIATLAPMTMPDATRTRLVETLTISAPMKDGALDREAFATKVTEAAKAELEYLAKVAGAGAIRGMGSSGQPAKEPTLEESAAGLEQSFRALGLSESGAKIAAAGRV
jgi:hypothetical protein